MANFDTSSSENNPNQFATAVKWHQEMLLIPRPRSSDIAGPSCWPRLALMALSCPPGPGRVTLAKASSSRE